MDKKDLQVRRRMGSHPTFYGPNRIYDYGDFFLKKLKTIHNEFWKNVVQSVNYVYTNAKMRGLEHVLAMPLWYNSRIMDGNI